MREKAIPRRGKRTSWRFADMMRYNRLEGGSNTSIFHSEWKDHVGAAEQLTEADVSTWCLCHSLWDGCCEISHLFNPLPRYVQCSCCDLCSCCCCWNCQYLVGCLSGFFFPSSFSTGWCFVSCFFLFSSFFLLSFPLCSWKRLRTGRKKKTSRVEENNNNKK